MNVRQFLDYKNYCPLCDNKLHIIFHSHKNQKIRYEEDRLNIIFNLSALKKKHIDYKVAYSFDLSNDSFRIEFYTKDEKRFDNDSPLFLINRFKELDKNLKRYRIFKSCLMCQCYYYSSENLSFNFTKSTVGDFSIEKEYFGMNHFRDNNHATIHVCKLLNNYSAQESTISCFIGHSIKDVISDHYTPLNATVISLPLIKFTSKEETLDRIKKLLLFS